VGWIVDKKRVWGWARFTHKPCTPNTPLIHSIFLQEATDFAIKFELSTENIAITTITTLIYKQDTKNNAIS
jgi:hypothetical protein